jgi:hypothetical protein
MENANLLTVFIIVTSIAVMIQAGILIAMYLALRKTSARMEGLAEQVKAKVLPTADMVQAMIVEYRPKVDSVVANVAESTSMVRAQMQRVDGLLTDIVDRTRLQVIRTDEMVNRTLDKVESATEVVQRTVVFPVRQISGIFHGVTAGLEYLVTNKRKPRNGSGVPQDEMFI